MNSTNRLVAWTAAGLLLVAGGVGAGAQDAPATTQPTAPTPPPAASVPTPPAAPEAPAAPMKKLSAGDAAPAMVVEKWVKGEPVAGFEKGKVYVLEFWSSLSGESLATMPYLSELQGKYKDKGLTVIGVTWEDDRGNTLEAVEQLVKDKGESLGYTIAWDGKGQTHAAYMKAARRSGVPASFVVDKDGKIAFIGRHPMQLALVLDKVLEGKWDAAKDPAGVDTEWKAIIKAQGEVLAKAEDDPAEGLKALKEFGEKYPMFAKGMDRIRFDLERKGKDPNATATGMRLVADLATRKDAEALNELAWEMVDPDNPDQYADLEVAMKAATEGVRLSGEKDGMILDTLARCYWVKGDKGRAIELQRKAVAVSPAEFKSQIEETLKEYEASQKN